MTQHSIIPGIVLIVLVVGGVWLFQSKNSEGPAAPEGKISAETDMAIRTMVVEFGSKLKNISLLMSPQDVASQMDTHYGAYVVPELLTTWKTVPAQAIGRSTSSPWPDRIEVVSVSPRGNSQFVVEGNVIEVTSADTPLQPAAVYPVTLVVESRNGTWMIVGLEKGAYSELPQRITVEGIWECLPHKDTTGPQTDECALGVARDQSDAHFAVDTMLMSATLTAKIGDHVRVEGIMTSSSHLSSDWWQKYPIDGIISATMVQKI